MSQAARAGRIVRGPGPDDHSYRDCRRVVPLSHDKPHPVRQLEFRDLFFEIFEILGRRQQAAQKHQGSQSSENHLSKNPIPPEHSKAPNPGIF